MNPLVIAAGPDDPRLYDIDADFREVLVSLSGIVAYSASRRTRFLHATSVGARGWLRVVDDPDIPALGFFRPGRVFPVAGRYSNSQGEDDHEVSVRGLSLRLLGDDGTTGLLDLTFNTGECFFAPTADAFRQLTAETDETRDEVLHAEPRLRSTMWASVRTGTAFGAYEMYSQAPRAFLADDGSAWLARYRVRPADEETVEGTGRFDAGDLWWPPTPPEAVGRPPGETGSPTALRDDLRARIGGGGVESVLQIQLYPVGDDVERALDVSRPWPAGSAWVDLAHLRFDAPLPPDETDAMFFDPLLAPPELNIPLSRSPHSTASVSHLRALMYRMTAAARRGEALPSAFSELLRPELVSPSSIPSVRTVCVIGAGPAGLTAARELERLGHRAIVLEKADHVAGKAVSVVVDGHPHDLGAHICTARYHRLAALAGELGIGTEPTPAERMLTTGPSGRTVENPAFFVDGSVERYEKLRAEAFPRIGEPGLAHSVAALSAPLSQWLAEHDLGSMYDTLGLGYTCAGYGYPDDDLPALYFVKYAEVTGLLSESVPSGEPLPARFTVTGGFGALWEKVAADLGDVRLSTTVRAVERRDDGVLVTTDDGVVEADGVIITVPPDRIVDALDASDDERRWAENVRYEPYRTTVASASGLPREAFYLLGEFADDSADRGHPIGIQHRYPDSDVYTLYSFIGAGDPGEVLAGDLAAQGGRDFHEHLHRDFDFMPHFRAGRVLALEEMEHHQGRRNTWFTGGLLGFESVECVMSHAQDLVRRWFGGRPVETDAAPAVTRSAGEIRAWFADHLAAETGAPVDPDGALSEYPLDSLTLAGLMTRLSEYVGFRVPHTLFLQLPTVNAAAAYLAGRDRPAPVEEWQSAVRRSFAPGATPFFCVGGIAATGVYFRPLATALGPDHPLYPFEIPGRADGVGEASDDVEEIAEGFVRQIRALQPHGPYRLGGHSYGGVIAYEMGRQLKDSGAEVLPVTLLDTFVAAPGRPGPDDDELDALRDLVVVRHMTCVATGVEDCGVDLGRPLTEQRDAVARALGAVEEERYDEHLASLVDVQLSSLRAYADYPFPPSDLAVHVLRTEAGFAPMPVENFGLELYLDSPANGWEHVGLGSLEVSTITGNHFSMFLEPHVRLVRDAVLGAQPAI